MSHKEGLGKEGRSRLHSHTSFIANLTRSHFPSQSYKSLFSITMR